MKILLNSIYGYNGVHSINERYYLNKSRLHKIGETIIRGFDEPIPPKFESFANYYLANLIVQNELIRNYKKGLGIYEHK